MKIIFYNNSHSKVPLIVEITYLPTYLLMADTLHFDSMISGNMMIYGAIDHFSDDVIIEVFANVNQNNEQAMAVAKRTKELYNTYKDLKKIKHKDKKTLVEIGQLNFIFKNLREKVKYQFEESIQSVNFLPILPFYGNNVLTLSAGDIFNEENDESKLLTEISSLLINNDATLSLSDDIDDNFSFDTLTSTNKKMCSYIKIPLWIYPPILVNSFEYLNYTRNELLPFMQAFKESLAKLQTEFFSIDFTPDNLPVFKQKINETIIPHVLLIQKAIDESLFIQNIKNGLFNEYSLVFCLGIAPAETIINYYEHFEIIRLILFLRC